MYQYHEYIPDIRLILWVKNYWIADGFVNSDILPKVFPDGCTDIIYIFDKAKGSSYTGLFGTMTRFIEVEFSESTLMFGIRFKPAGITAFTRVPVDDFTDWSVDLSLVDTLFDPSYYETLPEKQSVQEIISHTDRYLLDRLPLLYHTEKQIIRAVDLICLANGQVTLADVASEVCFCQRHFERKFKSTIGISPKMFTRIRRFNHAMRCLKNYPSKDLLTIAVECGYYDHTHLIKDFKVFAGETPTGFR